ncbi:hypothetical protein [Azotosporobacter soli]|uniref:hypothetical protein n=1 Tax=Azotosporobacter soli TaxID=3055040 RepID=UPI0031FE5BC5
MFRRFKIGIFLLVLVILSYEAVKPTLYHVDIAQEEMKIKADLNEIQIMPGSQLKRVDVITKSAQTHVDKKFIAFFSYHEINDYYENEMKRLGWDKVEEKDIKIWGKDKGSKEIRYRKNEREVYLYYRGADQSRDDFWTYAIGASWKL